MSDSEDETKKMSDASSSANSSDSESDTNQPNQTKSQSDEDSPGPARDSDSENEQTNGKLKFYCSLFLLCDRVGGQKWGRCFIWVFCLCLKLTRKWLLQRF